MRNDESFFLGLQAKVFDDPMQTAIVMKATARFILEWMEKNQPPELKGRWDLVDGGRPGYIVVKGSSCPEGSGEHICSLILKATSFIGMNFPALVSTGAIMCAKAVKIFTYTPGIAAISMGFTPLGPHANPDIIKLSSAEGDRASDVSDRIADAIHVPGK